MTYENLSASDPEVFSAISDELRRQRSSIELIASENFVSEAVMEAVGSPLTNKYAEGLPGKRYYGGCWAVDRVENLARERACKLFGSAHANVQPHSGAQANYAALAALAQPGDKIMGMALDNGGHLTHGSPANFSGKLYNVVSYGVDEKTELIDMDAVEALAREHSPKVIIAGASAYPRIIDFARFAEIAHAVGAYLMVDMAHIAGLVATGRHPSPVPFADVTTTTTHKTLRGPRGGLILTNDPDLAKKVDSAVFPGSQGGPLEHVIAGKAVAFGEALAPEFAAYADAILVNARALDLASCEQVTDLSDYIADVKIVRLAPEPVIYSGSGKILTYDGKFIVLSDSFVEYNADGSFSKTIGRVGRGPGEFVAVTDFCVDDEAGQLVCLTPDNKVLRYSLEDGSLVKELPTVLRMNTDAIFPLENRAFAIFCSEPVQEGDALPGKVKIFDADGNLTEELLPTAEVCIPMGFRPVSAQSCGNAYTLSFAAVPSTAYEVSGGKITPLVDMDFGSRNLPSDYFGDGGDVWSKIGELFENDYFKCPSVCHTEDLYYVSPYGKDSSVWNFISDGRKGIYWQSSSSDTQAPLSFSAADDGYFYFAYTEYGLEETQDPLKKYLIDECGLVLGEDDNMAIVGVKFRL